MQNILYTIQIIISVLLMVAILVQQKGSGLGSAFGGGDSGVPRTKRGPEKFIVRLTIVLAILFLASAIANFFIV